MSSSVPMTTSLSGSNSLDVDSPSSQSSSVVQLRTMSQRYLSTHSSLRTVTFSLAAVGLSCGSSQPGFASVDGWYLRLWDWMVRPCRWDYSRGQTRRVLVHPGMFRVVIALPSQRLAVGGIWESTSRPADSLDPSSPVRIVLGFEFDFVTVFSGCPVATGFSNTLDDTSRVADIALFIGCYGGWLWFFPTGSCLCRWIGIFVYEDG